MCTVTYIPTKMGIIITSSRDEAVGRSASLTLSETADGLQLLYPKDSKAAGTWIAVKNNGELAVLLNGAFENHEKKPTYRESRGTIFLSIFGATLPEQAFTKIDLNQIENFTLILYQNKSLIECRWDGQQKYITKKAADEAHIWSSATLYNQTVSAKREKWFSTWLGAQEVIDQQSTLDFHYHAGEGIEAENLMMQRSNGIATVSITSTLITADETFFNYHDLGKQQIHRLRLPKKPNSFAAFWDNLTLNLRIYKAKIRSWEYWPMHLTYAPMYMYWFYLSFKAKSFFFFSAANPKRKHAGFAMESKNESFAQLPQHYYPKTVLVKAGTSITDLKLMLDAKTLDFPVMAKPDMGERGTGVQLINDLADLDTYGHNSSVDFLVQEFIGFNNEAGIFYCRIPGSPQGQLTGIVGKELPTVTGDGKSTLEQLIKQNERYLLQYKKLRASYGSRLYEVLPLGEKFTLAHYGNHCRGAKFVDLSQQITPELTQVIDRLCQQLPDFYFGRLDMKFNSWEEFYQGQNFSVIELNGAASEPAHIYDPKHSIFFAWAEIKKHWDLLYQISMANAKTTATPLMSTKQGMEMLRSHTQHVKKMGVLRG